MDITGESARSRRRMDLAASVSGSEARAGARSRLRRSEFRTRNSKFKLTHLFNSSLLLNLLVPFVIEDGEALINVTSFHVPSSARVGESRRLRCAYKLNGGETLHAMKLFKDEKEFYRYSPGARDQLDRKMVFPTLGVQVDARRSDEHDVVLRSLTRQSAGLYKCQVSVEGTFKSVSAERRMEVSEAAAPWSQTSGEAPAGNRQQQQQQQQQQQRQRMAAGASSIQQQANANHGINSNNIASNLLQVNHQRQMATLGGPKSSADGSSLWSADRQVARIPSLALSSILITLTILRRPR